MKKESLIRVIEACALLVLGVIFCVSLAWKDHILSIILGSAMMAVGAFILIGSIIKDKSTTAPIAMGGLLALALGLYFIVASEPMAFIKAFVPYILLVFGSALFIDAFIGYFARNEKVLVVFIIKLVVGTALIVVGSLLLTITDFAEYVTLIIGISLILVAIANISIEFFKANKEIEQQ